MGRFHIRGREKEKSKASKEKKVIEKKISEVMEQQEKGSLKEEKIKRNE